VPALLEVRDVSRRFGGVVVVDSFSFQLAAGEALGIVGPNGAGKTTLLNLLAGDLKVGAGAIVFDGQDVTRLAAHHRCRLGIGRTAQIPRPFERMTAFENVLVGATFGRARDAAGSPDEAAVDALRRIRMLRFANEPAGSLTLLQRKRLELGRALATGPRLLLLDEIAGGLTEAEVLELVDLIVEIRGEGIAVVWIEHIVHALLRVVDRMIAIDFGRKVIEGEPDVVMASDAVRAVYLGQDVAT
jgi:branched-chain amino acid transport system ATP-binding protein